MPGSPGRSCRASRSSARRRIRPAADRHGRRCEDERNVAFVTERGGDGPDAFAFQVDVEDGQIEVAALDRLQGLGDAIAGARTWWPSDSRKSSSIIAISGSSSTIRMLRARHHSRRIAAVSAEVNSFSPPRPRAVADRLGQLLDREGLGQEGDIVDVDRFPELLLGVARHEQDRQVGPALRASRTMVGPSITGMTTSLISRSNLLAAWSRISSASSPLLAVSTL